MAEEGLTLYVLEGDPNSEEAEKLLKNAGFDVTVKVAPIHYRAAYGVPVLFSRFGISQGVNGVRRFAGNVRGVTY